MTAFVADASVVLAWYFPDEATHATDALRDELSSRGICVPSHWALEVTNALLAARRRKRLGETELVAVLDDLRALPDDTDAYTDQRAWGATLDLAAKHSLTTYDAAYLELALRRRLPLATLDKALVAAAQTDEVEVLI